VQAAAQAKRDIDGACDDLVAALQATEVLVLKLTKAA
jgi:hypothetical protein